jgi:peptidoglycan/xylan/chitin deacetylase (PgdA/CDA1 family)
VGGGLRIVFLVGQDHRATRLVIDQVCRTHGVTPASIVLDAGRTTLRQRIARVRRNIARRGVSYVPDRLMRAVHAWTERQMTAAGPSELEIDAMLRKAFPDECFSLSDLGRKFGCPVIEVDSLNSPAAQTALRAADADLGIVLGTRILRRSTFAIPRLGCLNLHKGRVPDYRGLPPGYWELNDNADSAGVTVHFVDDGLDTGDIVATGVVSICQTDTPDSLLEKLHVEGARVMANAVESVAAGIATRTPQPRRDVEPRTRPSAREIQALRERLPHWRVRSQSSAVVKNVYTLLVYHAGIYDLVRRLRSRQPRASILLYHRVNDYANDVLTVDRRTMAAQLIAVGQRHSWSSTEELVETLRARNRFVRAKAAVHFDDGYEDVYTGGMPLLRAARVPATAFLSSGFLDSDRPFDHDQFPFRFRNLRIDQVRAWIEAGFGIGAHTVNHIDLGSCSLEQAEFEIAESRRELEQGAGGPFAVTMFAFPFGATTNIRPEVVSMVKRLGYCALFSAQPASFTAGHDPFDIPRIAVNSESRVLPLLLEMEGLGPGQLLARLRNIFADRSPARPESMDTVSTKSPGLRLT